MQSPLDVHAGVHHSNHSDLEVEFRSAQSNICNLYSVVKCAISSLHVIFLEVVGKLRSEICNINTRKATSLHGCGSG